MKSVEATGVERRKVLQLVLLASSAAVLIGVIVLLIKVRSVSPEPQIAPSVPEQAAAHAVSPLQSTKATPPGSDEPQLPTEVNPPAARAAASSPPPAPPEPPRKQKPPPLRAPQRAYPPPPPPGVTDTMREVTRSFDRGDFAEARKVALEVLGKNPHPQATERMLRIAASSSCALGEAEVARSYYEKLTPRGQSDIARSCSRYGIEF